MVFEVVRLRWVPAIAAVGLLAGCGGGGDEAVSTTAPPSVAEAPPTSPPPVATTTPAVTPTTVAPVSTTVASTAPAPPAEVALSVEVATDDGFLSMSLPEGWSASSVDAANQKVSDATWSPAEAIDELLVLRSGLAEILVARDAQFLHNPGVGEFNTSLLDYLGIEPQIELTGSPLGDPGYTTTTDTDGLLAALHTAEVDGQFVAVLTTAASDDPVFSALPAILESVRVDASVIGPLAHAADRQIVVADATGEVVFEVGVLVPATWQQSGDDELRYLADGGDIVQRGVLAEPGDTFESLVAALFAEGAAGWFGHEPVVEERSYNDVDYLVHWDGPPGSAEGALLAGFDGAALHVAAIRSGSPELLAAMVDSVWVAESAVNPR